MKILTYTALALALVTPLAGAQAQQRPAAQVLSSIPANSLTATVWHKQNVYDPGDNKIGEIMDVLVDREGKISTLIIGDGGFQPVANSRVMSAFSSGITSLPFASRKFTTAGTLGCE